MEKKSDRVKPLYQAETTAESVTSCVFRRASGWLRWKVFPDARRTADMQLPAAWLVEEYGLFLQLRLFAMKPASQSTPSASLPASIAKLFWESEPASLDWEHDRDLIIRRVLTRGDWKAITWLRTHLGDAALRAWLERRQGDDLSLRQLRFWEIVLALPGDQVDAWVARRQASVWERRRRAWRF